MKEQLIQLASKKGFISKIIDKSVSAKYSYKDFYYLWLCELQNYLIECHNISVEVYHDRGPNLWYRGRYHMLNDSLDVEPLDGHKTKLESLEKGLQEILVQ